MARPLVTLRFVLYGATAVAAGALLATGLQGTQLASAQTSPASSPAPLVSTRADLAPDFSAVAARVTPAVCRASAGAAEHLPVAVVTNLARYLAEIKRGDLWVAAAVGESGTPMWQADLAGGLAFVFGAEGKGLRPLVRRTCDLEVAIPQLGRIESLNVSVAAAVLLYEARRQRDGRA